MNEFILVFVAALATALATGLGALPFAFTPKLSERAVGVSYAIAVGCMLGASGGLVEDGLKFGVLEVVVGGVVGVVAIALGIHRLERLRDRRSTDDSRRNISRGFILVAIMALHSFSEGIGVGVGWGGGESLGWLVTIAIAIHNIPEGLAISLVWIGQGGSVGRAAWMSVLSSLPQPLMAVPAFYFVEQFRALLPWGLGVAAGAMVWMSLADLLPSAVTGAGRRLTYVTVTVSLAAMVALQFAL